MSIAAPSIPRPANVSDPSAAASTPVPFVFVAHGSGFLDLDTGKDGQLRQVRCALGPSGVLPASEKREGDLASPAGVWPMRHVYYRPDRFSTPPSTALPLSALKQDDGWCDAANDPMYNRPVKLPYPASAENMWRDDALYDIVVVLGHNDSPAPQAGMGSAIFLHIAREGYTPTHGCIAVTREHLLEIINKAKIGDALEIRA